MNLRWSLPILFVMAGHDDTEFRVKPGRIRDRSGGAAKRSARTVRGLRSAHQNFLGEVHQAIRRAGGNPKRLNAGDGPSGRVAGKGRDGKTGGREAGGRFNARGRGASVAASLAGRSSWSRNEYGGRMRARRVAVKVRIVKLNPQKGGARGRQFVSSKAVSAHLRYLQRDGVTKDGAKGQVYSANQDVADGDGFLKRGQHDRHQFRFIVSAEDGSELSDLRATTRNLMRQMEEDLGTRLDWVAVDHHNTEHPHTHIIVRGVTDDGKTLNIAGDYIAHGVRERMSEQVTQELGRQSEWEVSQSLTCEVDSDRFTRLDRMLIEEQARRREVMIEAEFGSSSVANRSAPDVNVRPGTTFTDLRPDPDSADWSSENRSLLIARARKLERMGLATEVEVGHWQISERAEPTLRMLGEQDDIIRSMHRAVEDQGLGEQRLASTFLPHRDKLSEPIQGQVLSKGLGQDEMSDRVHLVVDGIDGRVHHVEVDASHAEDIKPGAIVSLAPPRSSPRNSDRNIQDHADEHGIYRPSQHLEDTQQQGHIRAEPTAYVGMHVRRLEVLRRAGIVERLDSDTWRVPPDLSERGLAYDLSREGKDIQVTALSPIKPSQQVTHPGATWLDKTMIEQKTSVADHGFGRDVQDAWISRKRELVRMGFASDLGNNRIHAPKDILPRLEAHEVERTGKALATQRGRDWQPHQPGNFVSGNLVGSVQLASGRFAMIDDGLGFSLVPWKPTLEQQIGKHISGVAMPGGGVDWSFGRKRGLGL